MRKSTLEALVIDKEREVRRLDGQNDRLSEKIVELEDRIESVACRDWLADTNASVIRLGARDKDQMAVSKEPEPLLSFRAQTAILAVALMIENRAETMAIRVGADAGVYADLCDEAHWLRSEAGTYPSGIVDGATALYEKLTTAF